MRYLLLFFLQSFLLMACTNPGQQQPEGPLFHFVPERPVNGNITAVIQGPNNFKIFYPADRSSGLGWSIASSPDLRTWTPMPNSISACNEVPLSNPRRLLSGTFIGDDINLSGLCTGPECILFLQTAWPCDENYQKTFEVLRRSEDAGATWVKTPGAITTDIELGRVRDPDIFFHPESGNWIMLAATDQKVHFFKSSNLLDWIHLSSFGPAGNTDLQWEKPQLTALPALDGSEEKHWLLTITSGHPAGKGFSAVQYFIGAFDGNLFTPASTETRFLDYGRDFISSVRIQQSQKNKQVNALISGKIGNLLYGEELPDKRLNGMLAFPRALSLKRTGADIKLIQEPFADLPDAEPIKKIEDLTGILHAKIHVKMNVSGNQKRGIQLLKTADQFIEIGFDPKRNSIYVDRSASGFIGFHPEFSGADHYLIRDLPETIELTILLDRNLVEVFIMNGEAVISSLIFPENLYGKSEWIGPEGGYTISGTRKR